jgi:hypothetical protein
MSSRTQREDLVFLHPFRLAGWTTDQPAGHYTLETEEELIEGLSFPAWRRVATTLLRRRAGSSLHDEAIPVDPRDLLVLRQADQAPHGA